MKGTLGAALILCSGLWSAALGQGLFEGLTGVPGGAFEAVEWSGFLRGALFGGTDVRGDRAVLRAAGGEVGLGLRLRLGARGSAYGSARVRGGYSDDAAPPVELREAYGELYWGPVDLRVGQQIIVWGRADGINPTNNLTGLDYRRRVAEEDERRLGVFALHATGYWRALRAEAVWVPVPRSAVFPRLELGPMVRLEEPESGSPEWDEGIGALRLSVETEEVGLSLSYLRGQALWPRLHLEELSPSGAVLTLEPYRHAVWGLDFETTQGGWGLRGELAYRDRLDSEEATGAPLDELQAVLGLERELLGVSTIVQYWGRFVRGWAPIPPPVAPADRVSFQVATANRMLHGQTEERSHAVMVRLARDLAHETVHLELMGLYSVTTEEWLFRPELRWEVADGYSLRIGAERYGGPAETLFGRIWRTQSVGYLEWKASF